MSARQGGLRGEWKRGSTRFRLWGKDTVARLLPLSHPNGVHPCIWPAILYRRLLDTNVVSEVRRQQPAPKVVAWLKQVDPAGLRLSVLTLGEIARGIHALEPRDPTRDRQLADWLDGLRRYYAERLLGIDGAVAEAWGHLAAQEGPLPVIDGLMVATSLVHRLTLVTRNVRGIERTGVPLINPWAD